MRIAPANHADFNAWLDLARQVEPLCGPMVDDPEFHAALEHHITCGTAFCARAKKAAPNSPLLGGMLWNEHQPRYEIAWLAVAQKARRRRVGRRLVDHALAKVARPATVHLTTFAEGVPEGEAARKFYTQIGFQPERPAPPNLAGFPCEELSLTITHQSTARAVIMSGKHYLLAQHHYVNPANSGKWSLIGGRIEDSERDPEAALRRELTEELSAPPLTIRPLHIYSHAERLHHIFAVTLDESRGPLRADPSEVTLLGWFTFAGVEALYDSGSLFGPFVYQAIRDAERSRK